MSAAVCSAGIFVVWFSRGTARLDILELNVQHDSIGTLPPKAGRSTSTKHLPEQNYKSTSVPLYNGAVELCP